MENKQNQTKVVSPKSSRTAIQKTIQFVLNRAPQELAEQMPQQGLLVNNITQSEGINTVLQHIDAINNLSIDSPSENIDVLEKIEHSYDHLADYFVALSNDKQSPITNLKLHRLVYYAQAWHLAILKRELISENFEAWVNGPIIPVLFKQYLHFGWKPIIREDLKEGISDVLLKTFGPDTQQLLEDVIYEYFGIDTYELEKLVTNEDPWLLTRGGIPEDQPSNKIIEKEIMRNYYSKFVKDEQAI
jgi:uncharacterized phage-associated protein